MTRASRLRRLEAIRPTITPPRKKEDPWLASLSYDDVMLLAGMAETVEAGGEMTDGLTPAQLQRVEELNVDHRRFYMNAEVHGGS